MVAPYNFHQHAGSESAIDNLNLARVENGKAPKSRLTDASRAQELGSKLVKQAAERSRKNAVVKGQADGNRPFNPQKLRSAGQAWRTNVNFGEAKATHSAALTPFYDLFTGAKYYFQVETDFGANIREKNILSQAITEEANYMVSEWDGFDFNIQAMLYDMVVYGKGFLYWLSKSDWRFEWLAHHLIFVPDNTKAHVSKLPVAVIRQEYLVNELWAKIENTKASEVGWNVPYVKHAIEKAYPPNRGNGGSTGQDYEAIQQRIRDNDICEGLEAEKIPVYHIFVREFDGTVTHLIVPENTLETPQNVAADKAKAVDFLYKHVSDYEEFSQVIAAFFFETLDGSWNGANGLGKEIFDAIEIKNRLKCSVIDGAFLRSGITMKAMDAASVDKASLIQIGPFSIIPPGFDVQNSQILGDLQGPMAADRMIESTLSQNIGIYRPKVDKPEGNPRTAEEVRRNFESAATLSNSAVNRFYLNLDRCYKELVRRLCKDSAFRRRCKDRGIPPEALDKIRCVKAYRTVGNGSAFQRTQALSRIGPLVPLMPESGRQQWALDTVAAETNQHTARRYFPDQDDDVMITDHAAEATIENTILKIGGPVLWTASQNNVIHAQTHLQFAAATMASLQEGGDPIQIFNTCEAIGTHLTMHVQHIAMDQFREADLKAITAQMAQLQKQTDELKKSIQQAQEEAQERAEVEQQAQQAEAGMDPDTRLKAAKLANDMKLKEMKTAQQLQHKQESHNQKLALSDAKTASGIAQSRAKTQASMQAQAEQPKGEE